MAEIINSSFIPKKEFKKKESESRGSKINLFFLISLVIFLSTIVASVGVYLWKQDLIQTNKAYEEGFAERSSDLGIESIKKFSLLDKQISSAKEILENHYDVLEIFAFLEKNTLGDPQGEVTLTELYLQEEKNHVSVKAKGRSINLTDIQRQSRGYASNPNISNLFISEVTKWQKGAYWVFNLSFDVDKKYLTERSL